MLQPMRDRRGGCEPEQGFTDPSDAAAIPRVSVISMVVKIELATKPRVSPDI